MFNKRQKDLVNFLRGNQQPTTAQQLADLFGVTSRTIRSDIELINQTETTLKINSSNLGYVLNVCTSEVKTSDIIPQTIQERHNFIIQQLLLETKQLSILDLSEQLYVSVGTIENDLKSIKEKLDIYHLDVQKNHSCLYLIGDEIQKRRLFRELLNQETTDNFMNLNKISKMFTSIDFDQMKKVFDRVCTIFDYKINGVSYHVLLIHIGVALERIRWGYYNNQVNTRKIDTTSKEFRLTDKLAQEMELSFQVQIPETEKISIYFLLVGNRLYDGSNELHNGISIEDFCKNTIDELNENFGISLEYKDDLKKGINIHLSTLLNRSYHNVELKNILLNDIKKDYPFVFELAIYFTRRIEQVFNCTISENEIGFIAMHLGIGLESQKLSNRYRAILIHPYENQVKDQLINFIESKFSSQIELVQSYGYLDEKILKESKFDLIISTVPLSTDFPYILISPLGSIKDESKISFYINELYKTRNQKNTFSILNDFFSSDLFFTDYDFETPKDVIRFLSERLYEKSIVSEKYYDSVMDRENISPTSFEQFVAVPHPIIFDSYCSKGAICILKKPILWGEYQVKIVILFAIKNEDRRKLKDYYSLIGDAIVDETSLKKLLIAKTYQQFIEVFSSK